MAADSSSLQGMFSGTAEKCSLEKALSIGSSFFCFGSYPIRDNLILILSGSSISTLLVDLFGSIWEKILKNTFVHSEQACYTFV